MSESQEKTKFNTFSRIRGNKRTPVTNAEQQQLPGIVGPVFRVIAAGNDPVVERDDDGQETGVVIERGTYSVMPVGGSLANDLTTPLAVKTKGAACIFNQQQRQQLMWSTTFLAFDGLRLWNVGGQEGLSADTARVVQLTEDELKRVMNGQLR